MNVIYEAILKGKHNMDVQGTHSWNALKKIKNPKIYIFGATKAGQYFVERYGRKYPVQGILDNCDKKQDTLLSGIKVYSPNILEEKEKDSLVVIICSTNYYKDIYDQLTNIGVKNIFILCKMEEKRAKVKFQVAIEKNKRKIQLLCWEIIEKKTGFSSADYVNRKIVKSYHKCPLEKKIVFLSGGRYKEHGKYISEALYKIDRTWDIVWILNNDEKCPNYVRRIDEIDSKQIMFELATAKIPPHIAPSAAPSTNPDQNPSPL